MTSTDRFDPDDLVRHGQALRRLARQLVGSDGADDLVQQTFATALARPPHSGHALRAWLHRVLRTLAIDDRRRSVRRRAREQHVAPPEHAPETAAAEQLAIHSELLDAVRALREPYLSAVWLRYYEDLTPSEIAVRLAIPVKTVKTRLSRALALLREQLDARHDGDRRAWINALVPIASGQVLAPASLGVLAMSLKNVVIAVAALVLAAGSWVLWPRGVDAPRAPDTGAPAAIPVADAAPPSASGATAEREPLPSAPSDVGEEYGALSVRVTWADDHAIAPGVAIVFRALGEPLLDRANVRVIADERGIARAPRLHAGKVELSSDRGGSAAAQVVAHTEQQVSFEVAAGVAVTGLVVDAEDRPVPAASVWLTAQGPYMDCADWLGGRVVATTDTLGRFRVRGVDPTQSLGACAPGFAPSELIDLDQRGTSATEITLHLARRGAIVAGRVTGEDGNPIAGALVAIGRNSRLTNRSDETKKESWSPQVVAAAEDGTFRCESVAPGTIPVCVRAEGFPLWAEERSVTAGDTVWVDIALAHGARVTGTVFDREGNPVAGAPVRTRLRPFEAFEWGEPASDHAFPLPTAITDAEGRYQLGNLRPGDVWLRASAGISTGFEEGKEYKGRDETTIHATADSELTWDAHLSLGRVIRGRVQTADGSKQGYLSILNAIPERAGGASLTTGQARDGGFRFVHCDDVPYTISLTLPGGQTLQRTGVRPDDEEVVLIVPGRVALGAIVGRVVDTGHRLASPLDVVVQAVSDKGFFRRGARLKVDGFRIDGLEPGRFCVVISNHEEAVHVTDWIELAPGQTLDLGDVHMQPGGSLIVRPLLLGVATLDRPTAYVGEGCGSRALKWDGHVFRGDNLSVGTQPLQLWSECVFSRRIDVEVVADQTREVTLEVVPAARVVLSIPGPAGATAWNALDLLITDSAGETMFQEHWRNLSRAAWPAQRPLYLPLGGYTLAATTDTGPRWSEAIVLRDLGAPATTHVVDLR